ncbi:MAG TPA: MOSC domain-containing protein [Vicinamibacteria bacterium]|jgi:MOSC domain-containing protein YiiM
MTQAFRVLSVNVARPREFEFQGKPATSSIWKTPVEGPIAARGVNLEGDDQADREVHGGPHKAVYSYSIEDIRWWEGELKRPLPLSAFGENLTTSGIDVSGALIGERWEIGTTLLEVSEPRAPCWKLGVKMEDPAFPRKFTRAGRPGAYLRIVREGVLAAGDEIRVVDRPRHGLRIGDVFRIYTREREKAARLLEIPELSEDWKEWARRQQA